MVILKNNVSAYIGTPPVNNIDNRAITGGPLYNKDDVRAIFLQGESSLVPWTRKCQNDLQALGFDTQDAIDLIVETLRLGCFCNSEWCLQSHDDPWAACDAYQLTRKEWVEVAHKNMFFEYFVKFAIGKTGKILLLISCHPSQEWS